MQFEKRWKDSRDFLFVLLRQAKEHQMDVFSFSIISNTWCGVYQKVVIAWWMNLVSVLVFFYIPLVRALMWEAFLKSPTIHGSPIAHYSATAWKT